MKYLSKLIGVVAFAIPFVVMNSKEAAVIPEADKQPKGICEHTCMGTCCFDCYGSK